jgi:3-methyladenine DNA glycosylase Tag
MNAVPDVDKLSAILRAARKVIEVRHKAASLGAFMWRKKMLEAVDELNVAISAGNDRERVPDASAL